jgi:mxaJ protein
MSWHTSEALAVAACCAAFLMPVVTVDAQRGEPGGTDPTGLVAEIAQNQRPVLRVCAHPENLPFSNAQGEGFENRLADLLAEELHAMLVYTWWSQRRGFIRDTLNKGRCDVIMGVPSDSELVSTTSPYYRSTFVFVARRSERLRMVSLDDDRLRTLRIGVHSLGGLGRVPPAEALAQRGIADNVRSYPLFGDYSRPGSMRAPIDAVARGEIDVAIVWGPIAGYFARSTDVPLDLIALPESQSPQLPMSAAIAIGVRRGDVVLRNKLDQILARDRARIERLLEAYGVPLAADAIDSADAAGDGPELPTQER